MGPRPRPRLPAPGGASRPAAVAVTTTGRVAPVGAPLPRRASVVPTVPLPGDTRAALTGIAKALRDVPRHCIHDPPEMFHWLHRQAKAIERLRDRPMSTPRWSLGRRRRRRPFQRPRGPCPPGSAPRRCSPPRRARRRGRRPRRPRRWRLWRVWSPRPYLRAAASCPVLGS